MYSTIHSGNFLLKELSLRNTQRSSQKKNNMTTPTFKLNDGNEIPSFGFGTFQIPADGSTYNTVKLALADGYRHIDTAVAYFNEQEVGKAIKDSGIPRDQIWVSRF